MAGRRGTTAAALAAAFLCALGAAATTQAASVTGQPPTYVKPTAGPLTWSFAPEVEGAPVAWRLSSETDWHRCTTDTAATFATLPDGRYSMSVADDVPGCSPANTTEPPTPVFTTRVAVVVDGTPPVVAPPAVTGTGMGRRITTSAFDALSGVASYTWLTGDGFVVQGRSLTSVSRAYQYGTFTGSVTVADRAGNASTQLFTTTVAPFVPPPDVTPPSVGIMRVQPGAVAARKLRVMLAISENATVSITVAVRAAGRTYRLPPAQRKLRPGRLVAVRVPVRRDVRRAIARALRRHQPVRAEASIALVDAAGNRAATAVAGRITR